LGNNLYEQWVYNSRQQPTGAAVGSSLATPSTASVRGLVFDYGSTGNNGNLQSQTIYGTGLGSTLAQTYGYDRLDRLASVGEGSAWNRGFTYDQYGNGWVSSSSTTLQPGNFTPTANVYDPTTNRINPSLSPVTMAWDNAGNQKADGGYQYTYDAENRVATSVLSSVTAYQYDGNGRRVAKVDCPSGTNSCSPSVTGATTTWYVYDADGQLAAEYTNGSSTPPCTTCYLTADHLGSTRVMTDQSGNPVQCHDYLPFGEEIMAGIDGRAGCYGSSPGIGVLFTGQMRDQTWESGTPTAGLDYFGARYFSAAQGRFTSPDPTFLNILKVTNPQRWNLYAYGLNNPFRYVDPDGEEAIAVLYPGYQVGVRGSFTLPLGHAGVVMVAKDGSTHYFEYGRYAGPDGVVRNAGQNNTPTPSVERDASGNITPASMKNLLQTLSTASGKGGEVDALVYQTADIEDMVMEAYLEARQRQNDDPNRQKYSLFGGHNCGTLICDAFDAAGHPSTPLPFIKSGAMPGDVFDMLRWYTQWSEQFTYTPAKPKEKVKSKICYNTEGGKQVCQQ